MGTQQPSLLGFNLGLCVECVASCLHVQFISTNGETRSKMWPNKFAVCLSSSGNDSVRYSTNNSNNNSNSWFAVSEHLLNFIVQQVSGAMHRNAAHELWRLLLLIYALDSMLWLIGRSGRSVGTTQKSPYSFPFRIRIHCQIELQL